MGVSVDFPRTSTLLFQIAFFFLCFVCLLVSRLRDQITILSSTQVGLGAFANYPGCSGLSFDCGDPAQAASPYPLPCVCSLTSTMPCRARVAPISLPTWLPPVLCRHGFPGHRATPWEFSARMPQTRYRQIPSEFAVGTARFRQNSPRPQNVRKLVTFAYRHFPPLSVRFRQIPSESAGSRQKEFLSAGSAALKNNPPHEI